MFLVLVNWASLVQPSLFCFIELIETWLDSADDQNRTPVILSKYYFTNFLTNPQVTVAEEKQNHLTRNLSPAISKNSLFANSRNVTFSANTPYFFRS